MLTGEVVRIEQDRTIVQTYVRHKNLSINEPVEATRDAAFTVRLAPCYSQVHV